MVKFKIIFPSGYDVKNINNDNIDINVVLPNERVYFATLFTLQNIQMLMQSSELSYFWSTDMIIVKNLEKETIKKAVTQIIAEFHLEVSFSQIGTIKDVYPPKKTYGDLFSDI
jgi:hypothetical protein